MLITAHLFSLQEYAVQSLMTIQNIECEIELTSDKAAAGFHLRFRLQVI